VFAEAVGIDIPIEILSMGTWLAGHALVAEKFQQGRVFIAGDAVHLFTPTGGLGYNTAVEDAVNLAWKLASVIRGLAPVSLLETYETERRPLAQRNTGYARYFADSIGLFVAKPELDDDSALGEQERRTASEYLNRHARLEFNIPGVTFGGRYNDSSIIVHDSATLPSDEPNEYTPTASPGGRPPHAWLDDGRSLYDAFHSEWTLLELGNNPSSLAQEFAQAASAQGMDLAVVHLPQKGLRELYQASLVLIRPDQIVAWRGEEGTDVLKVLAHVMGIIK
jgi:hypothetical protein